jgi:hypothetical protein
MITMRIIRHGGGGDMSRRDEKTRLNLFIEKAEKLRQASFLSQIATDGLASRINMEKGTGTIVEFQGPEEEFRESFLLTLRLFCQDNDDISLRNMQDMIDQMQIDQSLKDIFTTIRGSFNKYLDSETHTRFEIDGNHFTRRRLFDTFLYGDYAHVKFGKKERVDEWRNQPFSADMAMEFDLIVLRFSQTVLRLSEVCQRILAELD